MTGDQLRMARALLRLGIRELSARADVSPAAILRMEAGRRPHAATEERLRRTLEEAGIVFIAQLSPFHEAGVAMRFGVTPPAVSEDSPDEADSDDAPTTRARGWEEADAEFSDELVAAMTAYWTDDERWARLSEPSRRALAKKIRRASI